MDAFIQFIDVFTTDNTNVI